MLSFPFSSVFFFFACFGDSLSQAAQSFYPQVVKKSRGKLIKRLFLLSAVVGVNNYLSSNLVLQRLGHFLSKDASIIKMMSQYAPFVGYSVFLHPFIMVLEVSFSNMSQFLICFGCRTSIKFSSTSFSHFSLSLFLSVCYILSTTTTTTTGNRAGQARFQLYDRHVHCNYSPTLWLCFFTICEYICRIVAVLVWFPVSPPCPIRISCMGSVKEGKRFQTTNDLNTSGSNTIAIN